MFDRIKSFFREVRIDLDFPRYERQQRDEHERQTQRRFSTEQLNIEKGKLLKTIESEAGSKFNASIHEKENNKKQGHRFVKHLMRLLQTWLQIAMNYVGSCHCTQRIQHSA